MGFLKKVYGSLAGLLACLVAGAMVGKFVPEFGDWASVLAQLYLGVIGMAALPLLVVATFFGLRQTLALPQPGRRGLMLVALAIALVASCAAVGTLVAAVVEPGGSQDQATRAYLGGMVQKAGSEAGDAEMLLNEDVPQAVAARESWIEDFFPSNFFRALADGKSLGILLCAILFGLAFATLTRDRNTALTGIFEAVYRALEIIISRVNMFIPVLVFSMAAFFVARTDGRTIAAMGGFIGWFLLLSLALSAAALAIVRKQCDLPMQEVMGALKTPMLISLTSASTTASIPDTIEAMSSKLGFSRGIVELVTPISSVFMRGGSALYFALATVFVANLYGRSLGPQELAMVAAGASLAAFASAGHNSVANVGYTTMVLGMLQLPTEAALALFLAIDLICEGPRNLLTLLSSCALMSLVSRGLPSERAAAADSMAAVPAPAIRFAFTRTELLVGAGGCLAVVVLVVLLGVGVGLKRGADTPSPRVTVGMVHPSFARMPA